MFAHLFIPFIQFMACWFVISNGVQNVADNINNHDPKDSHTTSYQRQYSTRQPLTTPEQALEANVCLALAASSTSQPPFSCHPLKHYKYLYACKYQVYVWGEMA